MKKLLLVIAICSFGIVSYAQNYPANYAGQLGATVTHATAGTDTASVTINGSRSAINFKYDITKNSGTVAGTIVLQGRISSSDTWVTINTYTLTDATATNNVLLTANQYVNYRVIFTTTGTNSTTHKKWLLYRGY